MDFQEVVIYSLTEFGEKEANRYKKQLGLSLIDV
ncbi:hypothetical protein JOD45_001885 [Scopulibacillus daqui]|uniref:PadR family transcriptional regulator n=1 Tax=Scopulibacillus daqui TaxID=1469162 RepID=A0ABS2Q297_9BACL|nr:hypothetical protein [Scopulibacillus daqui]